jgi:hypothetical protein
LIFAVRCWKPYREEEKERGGKKKQKEKEKKRCCSVPPFDLHDTLQQPDNLLHPAVLDKLLDPGNGLVAQQQPQLVKLTHLDLLRLAHLSKVRDEVGRSLLHLDLG